MADKSGIVQQQTNLKIYEITIIGKNGELYKIWPEASNMSYVSLSLLEGMFEASVSGTLYIKDLNSTAEQINFSGFDDLVLKFENPDIPNSYKSLKYKIYNVTATDDQIKENLKSKDSNVPKTMLKISFTSYEHYLLSHKEFSDLAGSTGADIIAPISTSSGFLSSLSATTPGLVNSIYEKFFQTGKIALKNVTTTEKPMYIEATQNWVWYKQNQLLYPWSKLNRPVRINQLLQYLAENAVSADNPYACNFLFWQDLDKWNFRSVENLAKLPSERTYAAANSPYKTGNIFTLEIVNEANFLRLFESNALASKYYLVEPKWDHPYREYLDYNESHNITEITYDYFRDYNKWQKIEKYPLIVSDANTKPTATNVVNDKISGYFSPNYSNKEKTVAWEHYGYTFSNRDSSNTWQPMFDQTTLDGEICKKIQKEIKEVIKDKKIEYAKKKNLKEKWKVYRCSICCDNSYTEAGSASPVFTQEYKIISAGGFTDMVNYDSGITLPSEMDNFPLGLSLSYDFDIEPFSKTIGEIMYLRESPDIQTKYLYELELKKLDIAEELLDISITRLKTGKQVAQDTRICDQESIEVNISGCEENGKYVLGGDLSGITTPCFCSEEKKSNYIRDYYDSAIKNKEDIRDSGIFTRMREIVLKEKDSFIETYSKYRDRKAFFISKEFGFTASTPLNLFNVKTIKRVPIRGSKYEKLAKKTIAGPLYGLTGDFQLKGFPVGVTSYYPYEIFYDGDSSIDPSVKHPYYDSGYNFDIGYNASPTFSVFDEIGGPNSGSPVDPTSLIGYYAQYKYTINRAEELDTWIFAATGGQPDDGGGYGGQGTGGGNGGYGGGEFNFKNFATGNEGYTAYYCNQLERYQTSNQVSISKVGYAQAGSSQPDAAKTLQEFSEEWQLNYRLKKEVESFVSSSTTGADTVDITYNSNSAVIEVTYKPISQCEDKIATQKITITVTIDKWYTDNKGNDYLTGLGLPYVCISRPFGAERLKDFNPDELINYLNSRNFLEINTITDQEEPKRPIENILEEIESFVRIEFERPIGETTLYDFPQGFYDTIGSEYFLPYHVMLTAGPFGTKSSDYNISVLGQDPYGFDVAVKRIRKKKQDLLPDKKALVNNKDYHVITNGYNNRLDKRDSYYYLAETLPSYGYGGNFIANPISVSNNYPPFNSSILGGLNEGGDDDQHRLYSSVFGDIFNRSYNPTIQQNTSEILYLDILKRATRINPLSLPNSYFQIINQRPMGIIGGDSGVNWWSDPSSVTIGNVGGDAVTFVSPEYFYWGVSDTSRSDLLLPGNVFSYIQTKAEPFPIDTSYFKSEISYYPEDTERKIAWTTIFELDVRNFNDRYKPEEESVFYGYYIGSAIWKHPAIEDTDALSDEEIQKAIWKNDISGESEYGLIGPELDQDDSVFDRNFAAQFIVIGREEIGNPYCDGYPCANVSVTDNSNCPKDDPLCNCPCQELRPDKMTLEENRPLLGIGLTGDNYGLVGAEPTRAELLQLEKEMKECELIDKVLGKDWLGCVWNDPSSPLNCNCPCIGSKFQEYLRYSQTYCTFWNTPPERPLLRNAQMMQLIANKIVISVNGDFTMRPGMKVTLDLGEKRYSGDWLISTISHDIAKSRHLMSMALIRDSDSLSPDKRSPTLKLNT